MGEENFGLCPRFQPKMLSISQKLVPCQENCLIEDVDSLSYRDQRWNFKNMTEPISGLSATLCFDKNCCNFK